MLFFTQDEKVVENSRIDLMRNNNEVMMVIRNVEKSDEGLYHITISNAEGCRNVFTKLSVMRSSPPNIFTKLQLGKFVNHFVQRL
jgi:Immunoglobulin I-set domain